MTVGSPEGGLKVTTDRKILYKKNISRYNKIKFTI
jgi:hypothetical protein